MKKPIILFFAIAALLYACDSSKNESTSYTIDAEIVGVEDATLIYLQLVREGNLESIDSSIIKASKVSFKGSLESPEMIYLRVGNSRKMVNLFGENSTISVKVNIDSLDQAKVVGSSVHDELMAYKKYLEPIDERSARLNEAYRTASQNSDNVKINEVIAEYDLLRVEQINMIKKFVSSRPDSYISPFIIQQYLAYEMDYPELDSMLVELSPDVHDSKEYQNLSERVSTLRNVAIGQPAVDFALNDTNGNPIAISSFQGKILLIDFWASWCAPCRRENPNVVKLYKDFSDKGFEIIGVSFDDDHGKWVNAIQQDELTWPHVSDLKGWASAAGKLYAINSIPATVLLDREGNIIAKNLRGEALRKKLEEIYAAEGQNI